MKAFAVILALFLCVTQVAAEPSASVPGSGSLAFGIWRGGARIGTHSYAFRQVGGDLIVEQRVDVTVRAGFVTLYRLSGRRLEVWRDGHIVEYDSETDDDGTPHHVRARPTEDGLVVEGDTGTRHLPPDAMPFGLWNLSLIHI